MIKAEDIIKNMQEGFYGFWVKRRRVTFLCMMLVLIMGIYAIISIPKESSPDVELGIISISTSYRGVDPINIDSLITEKIEKQLKDVDGIKKVTSTSRLGSSSISVELETGIKTSEALTDIKDAVDKAGLPSEADDPFVIEASQPKVLFSMVMYAPAEKYTQAYMKQKSTEIVEALEGKDGIKEISVGGGLDYTIQILVDKKKAEGIGISLSAIAQTIRANNQNQPLGNYAIGDLQYDFRIQGEFKELQDIERLEIPLGNNESIPLRDIATMSIDYNDESIRAYGGYQSSGYISSTLTFIKDDSMSIFAASEKAKENISQLLTQESFSDMQYVFTNDVGKNISQDYNDLASNGLQTVVIVFICLLIFVGFKESIIATITIPLAFCITFFVLRQLGLTMNFLTNFSLIICFGIAIDTTIVVIEGAHEKLKLGYNPMSAVLLAVKEYRYSLIAGTATTCFAFLPMLTLPGILGKFLAYIPITIFVTLIAALVISLTINSALYFKLSGKAKSYRKEPEVEHYFSEEDKILLASDREGKQENDHSDLSRREKRLGSMGTRYEGVLNKLLKSTVTRFLTMFVPFILLVLSFLPASQIGFEIFPASDVDNFNLAIEGQQGATTESMEKYIPAIEAMLVKHKIIDNRSYTISDQNINISIELVAKSQRKKENLGTVFDVEKELLVDLQTFASQGLYIESKIPTGGPPANGGAVGIKLVGQSANDLNKLIDVSKDFENYLKQQKGSKNISNSSDTTPGQFVFRFDTNKLAFLGLTQQAIQGEIAAATQGAVAGVFKNEIDDYTLRVKFEEFADNVSPSDIMNLIVQTQSGPIRIGDVVTYIPTNAINSLQKEDGKLLITVGADVTAGLTPDKLQGPLIEFADQYTFPSGVGYEAGGENQENQDLITAMIVAFFVAIILIYATLVLQFNSYMQPAVIIYSVVMAMIGVNTGLLVTGNPYSLAVMIGFLSLTGIVVNDAIVFISRVNTNIQRGMDKTSAISETGKSRLQPIILTTLTTVLGLQTIAQQDEFRAGLAYTIMFGLTVGSIMTLVGVPVLYYEKEKLIQIIKRAILSPLLFVIGLSLPLGVLFGILSALGAPQNIIMLILGALGIIAIICYSFYTIVARRKDGQTVLQEFLDIKILPTKEKTKTSSIDNDTLTLKHAIIRFVAQRGLLGLGILMILVGKFVPAIGTLGSIYITLLLLGHFVSVMISPTNQSLHDRIANTLLEDEPVHENDAGGEG